MGKLSFFNHKFHFEASRAHAGYSDAVLAQEAAFKYDAETLRWVTRNYQKAVKLRAFADNSAEQKFKKYFITEFKRPEYIVYPDHLSPKIFQLESAWHCLTRSPAYCADEAGLGKTIMAIMCINTVPGKTLIICPAFLKYNWALELDIWLHKDGRSVSLIEDGKADEKLFESDIIILPDSLLTNPRIKLLLSNQSFTWLIVDEAHRYKEATTQRTQSLVGKDDEEDWYYVAQDAKRIVLLSGTPIPNGRPIELYPLLSHLAPESIGRRSALEYGKKFCGAKPVARYEGRKQVVNWDFRGKSNLAQLRSELREKLMIRHLKKDVLKELPPKTRQIIFLDQPEKLEKYGQKVLKNHSLSDLIGEDYTLGDVATYRKECGLAKITPAFLYLQELLENSNEKLVVFAHHIDVVETLTNLLKDYHPLKIRGGMKAKHKQEQVRLFQTEEKHRVIVGNLDSMGVGNTLTRAPIVVVVEASWVPGVNEQAEDRIHRITQDKNVLCRYLILRNSLEERMLYAVIDKQDGINQVMS